MATATRGAEPTWQAANQRWLTAELARVRRALARHAGVGTGDDAPPSPDAARAARSAMDAPPALEHLVRVFGLSTFEADVLLVCAGVELDPGVAELCAALGDGSPRPTFGLALAALEDAHWSALAPDAALRRWRLVEVGDGPTLTSAPLGIDERVLHHLAGVRHLDENLVGFVRPVPPPSGDLVPSHRALAEEIVSIWTGATGDLPVIQLAGGEVAGSRILAAEACRLLGHQLYRLPAPVIPAGAHEFDALVRLWSRESVLSGGILLVDAQEPGPGDPARDALVRRLAAELDRPLLLAVGERMDLPERTVVVLEIGRPTRAEQRALWAEALELPEPAPDPRLDRITAQFDLGAPAIRAASLRARAHDGDAAPTADVLWRCCRLQARQRLEGTARCIEPVARWDDLVLPEAQLGVLREVERHVRHRLRVHEEWGFAARSSRGLGITALFSGPSGTGKTLAAEVLARELGLDLYHIDLSAVVSKYIGETEKNLARVFDAAESGGAVLLFDEADALFGKRSEVKDSHDRYANLEVSYLLQRMEAYRGLAVLTTNLKGALDEAFERRLRFRVAFPFPDRAQRAAIWRRVFPPETPTEGLDPDRLARLNATGGTIRNVALHAAFLAAEADAPVGMPHLRAAARAVHAQLERTLTEGELRGWT